VRNFLKAMILLPLILVLAPAQDAVKVEPLHYRLAFENDKVQVVYIHYGPHEKSREHSHPPGVVVSTTEAHLIFTDPDGKIREVFSKPGEARWFPALRHTVENIGETDYSGVYVGLKGNASAGPGAEDQLPAPDRQAAEVLGLRMLSANPASETMAASR
jgi:beta-alanine degradation protein BauB